MTAGRWGIISFSQTILYVERCGSCCLDDRRLQTVVATPREDHAVRLCHEETVQNIVTHVTGTTTIQM